ncbi:MAG: hypothetical protein EZS26_003405 [Candidatus Ordinivivax streblomastigis]|uniref:DUF5054 domain-containing protein n=1 Tax=Candidatus Ordinivivax streblomastigis TaxID=2540710 RepID=A0A5M8NUM5_9BACT|nr:MAG: hypothetical protein EZS26_003405 [Candidatus Ordinivivax streblomastigis]
MGKMKMKNIFLSIILVVCTSGLLAQEKVERVHVIFKTHLDIGFTDLSSKVEQRYINEFIPKAIAVAEQLRAEGGKERYVWTTGSWLVSAYLAQASPEAGRKLEEAIRQGDIVWNGVPYTVESEAMTKDLFEATLRLSQRLDKRFGKKTIAAKMTDVPGHTRSIVSPLYDAGIRFLHIGVNPASTMPVVPPVCIWKNTDNKEIILMYQGDYGRDMVLPDGKTAVSVNFTGDNHGPHTLEQVKAIYAALQKKYPDAEIFASTLNAVAADISGMTSKLPVVTSEIGDTWIHGFGSSPLMMAQFRALSRLYTDWVRTGKINPESDVAINFAVRLGLVAEHTWGLDVKSFVKNWDKYEPDAFNAARKLPEFRFVEESWKEKADNIGKAIALLPDNLQAEAKTAISGIGTAAVKEIEKHDKAKEISKNGALILAYKGINAVAGEITYQTFSAKDFTDFYNAYARDGQRHRGWAVPDFGKPGLENTKAEAVSLTAQTDYVAVSKGKNKKIDCLLSFPAHQAIDKRVLPQQISTEYIIEKNGTVEMTVSLVNKPANRLPEAYWVSFVPSEVVSIFAEKTGCRVNVLDVVQGGNRQMHGIDKYVDIVTDKGTLRITGFDAPVVAIGERSVLNYSTSLPDLKEGIHFCLFNNVWGTNFTMWWEGSISYRFKIEII